MRCLQLYAPPTFGPSHQRNSRCLKLGCVIQTQPPQSWQLPPMNRPASWAALVGLINHRLSKRVALYAVHPSRLLCVRSFLSVPELPTVLVRLVP